MRPCGVQNGNWRGTDGDTGDSLWGSFRSATGYSMANVVLADAVLWDGSSKTTMRNS
jgi:hypothetical protein